MAKTIAQAGNAVAKSAKTSAKAATKRTRKSPENTTESPETTETPAVITVASLDKAMKEVFGNEAPKETEEKPFVSLCGQPFDANLASTCHGMCKDDNPEAFAACLANYEKVGNAKKTATSSNKSASRGKTLWGHVKGCQGGLVDEILSEHDGAFTIEEIMEFVKGTRPRVLSHLKHLYTNCGVDLRKTDDGKVFVKGYKDDGLTGHKSDGLRVFNEDGTPMSITINGK